MGAWERRQALPHAFMGLVVAGALSMPLHLSLFFFFPIWLTKSLAKNEPWTHANISDMYEKNAFVFTSSNVSVAHMDAWK